MAAFTRAAVGGGCAMLLACWGGGGSGGWWEFGVCKAQPCTPHFEALGAGVAQAVMDLTEHDFGGGVVVVAGHYYGSAGALSSSTVHAWTGSAWTAVGPALGDGSGQNVQAVASYQGLLHAAGSFYLGETIPTFYIVNLAGGAWASIAGNEDNVPFDPRRFLVHDGFLYASGRFNTLLSLMPLKIARYDGAWHELSGGGTFTGDSIDAMCFFDPDGDGPLPESLIVGGNFPTGIGYPVETSASYIARWTGSGWAPLGAGCQGPVYSLCVFDEDGPGGNPPRLFAGGLFTNAGGQEVNNIARWDGSNWSPVGVPPEQGVGPVVAGCRAMVVHDDDGPGPKRPALYVTGDFFSAGGGAVRGIARWSGSAWSRLGPLGSQGFSGPGGYGWTLLSRDEGLYVGGYFSAAGGVPAPNIALWKTCHRCPADVATAGTGAPAPDGFVTGEDFDLFVQAFFLLQHYPDGSLIADVATAGTGDGYADGFVTGEDFDFFVMHYFKGC